MSNSAGELTNAVFGFVEAVRRMLADLQPEYKQQRREMPNELRVTEAVP